MNLSASLCTPPSRSKCSRNSFMRGTLKDDLEAVRWYRRAAGQGHEVAQGFLGRMYTNGEGVPQDLVLAHMWYNIAGANGLDVEIAFEATERLEAMMTPRRHQPRDGVGPPLHGIRLPGLRAVEFPPTSQPGDVLL